MELLIIIILLLSAFFVFVNSLAKKELAAAKPDCPPHRWSTVEKVVDLYPHLKSSQTYEKFKYRLICRNCGKFCGEE